MDWNDIDRFYKERMRNEICIKLPSNQDKMKFNRKVDVYNKDKKKN